MGDQQPMKSGFGQTTAQLPDTTRVFHWVRITGQRESQYI